MLKLSFSITIGSRSSSIRYLTQPWWRQQRVVSGALTKIEKCRGHAWWHPLVNAMAVIAIRLASLATPSVNASHQKAQCVRFSLSCTSVGPVSLQSRNCKRLSRGPGRATGEHEKFSHYYSRWESAFSSYLGYCESINRWYLHSVMGLDSDRSKLNLN